MGGRCAITGSDQPWTRRSLALRRRGALAARGKLRYLPLALCAMTLAVIGAGCRSARVPAPAPPAASAGRLHSQLNFTSSEPGGLCTFSCNESGVAAVEFFPASLPVAGSNNGLAYYKDLRSMILSPEHPFKVFTDDECFSMAEAHGLFCSLLSFYDAVQARPLPIDCWPGPPPRKDSRYLGGAKVGDASLYLWGDEPSRWGLLGDLAWKLQLPMGQGRVWADVTFGKVHKVLKLGRDFRAPCLHTKLGDEPRQYGNIMCAGDEPENNDCIVMLIGDSFFLYNYPRDLLIEIGHKFRCRKYRLESKLKIDGRPVKGRYEVSNAGVCTDGQFLYAGLKSVDQTDRAVYLLRAEPSQRRGAWPTTLLRKIDSFYVTQYATSSDWHVCIAVDASTVVVLGENRLYWWEKGQ